jgi:hypothetical protein
MAGRLRLAALLLVALASACFYTTGTVNRLELEHQGLSATRADRSDGSLRNFGRVRAKARGYLFGSCDDVARRALDALLAKAHGTGANRVTSARFRGRWRWMTESVCRRNLNYLLLVVPAFFPVPTSVNVSGYAIHDPDFVPGEGIP